MRLDTRICAHLQYRRPVSAAIRQELKLRCTQEVAMACGWERIWSSHIDLPNPSLKWQATALRDHHLELPGVRPHASHGQQEKLMSSREIVLCKPVRTAIGAFNGALKLVSAADLGATVVRETLKRSKLDGAHVGSVVMGNVIQAGNKMNPARQAAIGGGVPVSIPALTVNRVCGSGAQAIVTAAQEVALGLVDAAIAGGMENMDRAPYLLPSGRWGQR